jgi:hypothetical protein
MGVSYGFKQYGVVLVSAIGSLLAGASVVHNIYKPDVSLPKSTEKHQP